MLGSKILPFTLLGAAVVVVAILALFSQTPEELERQSAAPLVRVIIAKPTPHQFFVKAFGSVSPRTESDLIPQVTGEVLWISPSLAAGGFFESGAILARVDAADYRVDRETARAIVARAESEFGRAAKERDRQRRLKDRSVASESRIDDAENGFRVAEASLREARARLERATRDLARTEIKAPYRGRVRSKQVDVGQFVTRGKTIATLYAVDFAEIRLPVPDRELAYLDVPLIPRMLGGANDEAAASSSTGARPAAGSHVRLTAEFAGRVHHWNGTLVRTEAELDPRTRMVHLVARVSDPYGLAEDTAIAIGIPSDPSSQTSEGPDDSEEGDEESVLAAQSPASSPSGPANVAANLVEGLPASLDSGRTAPLAVGLFVEAEIEGLTIESAFVIPRDALREGDRVYVVDGEERIQFRDVEVLRTERDNVIVSAGLKSGERICTTPLEAAINGMRVRVFTPKGANENEVGHGLAKRSDGPTGTVQ